MKRQPIAGTEFVIRADLAFIAIGFAGPIAGGVTGELDGQMKLVTDSRRSVNVAANDRDYRTSVDEALGRRRRACAASRWSSGRSARAARPPAPSTKR